MLKYTKTTQTAATFNGASFGLATAGDWASIGDGPTREAVLAWLAEGNTPVPADVPDVKATALAKIRNVRTEAFKILDYMQLDALAANSTANVTAIQTARVALRDITKLDVSSLTTEAQINNAYKVAYLQIVAAMPDSLKAVYVDIQNA